jgi:HD-like signal output (HDOD) protein
MSNIVREVSEEIIASIKTDLIVLPTLPEIALKVRDVAENPKSNLSDIEKIICRDAALSARIVKVANSPVFRATQESKDMKMALGRLGMTYTANIAVGLAMEQMFQATSSIVDTRMRQIWQQSSEIAGVCHMLCKHRTKLRPSQAALGGLVHQIGKLPILSFAEEHPSLLKDSLSLDRVIKIIHPIIGRAILRRWSFPKELQSIPVDHLKFSRDISEADYSDLVTVAMMQTQMDDQGHFGEVDCAQVTSFARLLLEPETHVESTDLSAEMEAAMQMFNV